MSYRDPGIIGYVDAVVEVVIRTRCRLMRIVLVLDQGIQWCVGVYNNEQWSAGEHVGAWWCDVVHGFAPWSGRSDLHHMAFSSRVMVVLVHMGHQTYRVIQQQVAVPSGVQG